MIRGTWIVRDPEDDLPPTSCWLRASHLFFSSVVLMFASCSVLVASYYDDSLRRFRDPGAGILGLSSLSAVACGLCYMFIELRVQDKSELCRHFHDCLCCAISDPRESSALENVVFYKKIAPEYRAAAAATAAPSHAATDCCHQDLSPRNVM
ncbi:hypothetical protein LSH36_336g03011 [Paralvinella palmiformis]|uniref:Uncharacterized protein n=1 Tax=Paralvinella palmiformis TaxID=53620 RepID=A0AAD9JGG6_9ANNE|nr:hypothetical protein LSH36_336g03011 [Paralvinella palmiformis]